MNPYAAPTAPVGAAPPQSVALPDPVEALRALDAHFARPNAIAEELALDSPKMRRAAVVMPCVSVAALGVLAAWPGERMWISTTYSIVVACTVFFVLVPSLWLAGAMTLQPSRARRRTAERSARAFFRALVHGRGAAMVSTIAPPTRGGELTSPSLGDVDTYGGVVRIDAAGLREWALTFAAPSLRFDRRVSLSKLSASSIDDRVVDVTVSAKVIGAPKPGVTLAFGALIAMAQYYMTRKIWRGTWTIRMLRAGDGTWYVAHPSVNARG